MTSDEQDKFIPVCDESLKPREGKYFGTLDEGINLYKEYARVAGFDIRLSSARKVDGLYTWRYVLCSREGEKFIAEGDASNMSGRKKRRVSMRCGCNAKIVFKYVGASGYVVHCFTEEHNHELQYKHFMKVNRNIDLIHQSFILDCAKASIGPTHSYKLLSELLGGHDGVGCSIMEVRNFSRDMKAFVEGSDAQMLLNEMQRKKQACEAFVYEYEIDCADKLKRLFWCDPISKRNYHMFGDVVAFDTTYSTNKYCMIFAPFTGKDNHGKPVTFAAGLLSSEDAASFSWLFQNFVKCMGFAPSLIITDQDLGMKVAVERILIGTRHRWCMWHIMLKLADKVSKQLHANDLFKKRLKECVWSELIEPDVFEISWVDIMKTFGLADDVWFKTMFESRHFWVPAFFRDFRMSGLLRTTSISESENHFFKRYTRSRSNLLQFWMNFNNANDAQRHRSAKLNYVDMSAVPVLATKLPFEKQAALVFTSNLFGRVQEEIVASCFNCRLKDIFLTDNTENYKIKDEFDNTFSVIYHKDEDSYVCGCKMFGRMGILCQHIFFVFKNKDIKCIPDKYITGRWQKNAHLKPVHGITCDNLQHYTGIDEKQRMTNKVMSSFFGWVQCIDDDINQMSRFLSGLDDLGRSITGVDVPSALADKKKLFEDFYGAPVPDKIDVLPPDVVKTKGSGSRKVSRLEKAVKMKEKPLRRCSNCKQMAHHDSRNCGRKK